METTLEVPLCECHDEPKMWHKDQRTTKSGKPKYPNGGYWRCNVRHRSNSRKSMAKQYANGTAWVQRYPEEARAMVLAYTRQRYKDYHEWLSKIKGTLCTECGNEFPREKLHYHHLDKTTKSFTIANGWQFTRNEVLAEIRKCILVCGSCHCKIEPRRKK